MLATADFRAPLRTSIVPTRGTGAPTFTRATTATVVDHEGVLRTCLAGEARFTGARRVRNLIGTASENFDSADWTKLDTTVVANQAVAPDGTTTADLVYPTTTGTLRYFWRTLTSTSVVNSTVLLQSFYAKAAGMSWIYLGKPGTGSNQGAYFNLSTGEVGTTFSGISGASIEDVGNGWYRCSLVQTDTGDTSAYPVFSLADADNTTTATTSGTNGVFVWGAQLEDVTAQSVQTAGEYVSVGALCMDGDDNYLSLPGTAGNYASTPDSVAASITGDIDIRVKAALTDWTPASEQTLIAKWDGATNRSYLFTVAAARLRIYISTTGSASLDGAPLSTAGVSFVDGSVGWCRVTHSASTGDYKFYTSSDGTTWTQLGATVAGTAGSIYDSGYPVEVGSGTTGSLFPLNGKIYQAQIYNGIAGTLAVDFNPDRDATTPTGTITSSTTGEVWTINGASSLVRNNTYHGTGVDGVKCYDTTLAGVPIPTATLKGYLAEGARTNLLLKSQDFSTADWNIAGGNFTVTDSGIASPIAGVNFQKLAVTTTTNTNCNQLVAGSGSTSGNTYSVYVKKGSGATECNRFSFYNNTTAQDLYRGTLDYDTGVFTTTGGTGTAVVQTLPNGVYRLQLTNTAGVSNGDNLRVYCGFSGNVVTAGKYLYAIGTQVEVGPTATSYTPTTATAVTRNADVLTYPSAGNLVTLADYSIYCESIIGSAGLTSGPLIASTDLYRPFLSIRTEANRLDAYSNTSGTGPAAVAVLDTDKTSRICKYGMSKNSTTINAVANAVIASAAIGTQGAEISTICIGRAGGNILDGNISNVCFWARKLPDAILKRITK